MTDQTSAIKTNRISFPVVLVLLLVFLFGFASLLYLIIWQRLLVFFTGSQPVGISLTLSAIMTGFGIGYLVGGRLADRSSALTNLRYYVGTQLGIMGFAALSKVILYDFLYVSIPALGDSFLVLFLVVFGVLLLPTFLMGVSLPVLSRAFRFSDVREQARYISLLYFSYTLGAAVGVVVTGLLLIRWLGYHNAIWVGVAFSGICAVAALFLGRRLRFDESSVSEITLDNNPAALQFTPELIVWSVQYALSGIATVSLGLIWFRILETIIKSVSLTFVVLLAIYLGAMAIGTVVGTWLIRPVFGRSAAWRERAFLLAQTALYGYTGLSVTLFVNSISRVPALRFLWEFLANGEPALSPSFNLFTYGLVPVFLLFVPIFLMGLSFSLSQSLVQDKHDEVGRKVGWLLFINVVSSALGAWAITWVGFPQYGTATLLRAIAALSVVYTGILFSRQHWPALTTSVVVVFLLLCVLTIPKNARFWQLLNGVDKAQTFLFDENESAISVIKMAQNRKAGIVFVNGVGQGRLPFGTDELRILLGALPVMMHSKPERVAVIGLGSGGTVNSIAGRSETRQIDCFEVAGNQAQVLAEYAAQANDTAVNAILSDRRLQLLFRDGRNAIGNQNVYYDVITADALRPASAYSGNVYSREYFELVRSRLRPGGLVVTWCPTARVLNTFRAVFPYVAYCDKLVLIGSKEPIQLDWSTILQRAGSSFSRQHYGRSGIDMVALIERYRQNLKLLPPATGSTGEINTDLFPKDEYKIRAADRIEF